MTINRKDAKSAKFAEIRRWKDDIPRELNDLAYRVIGAAIEVHSILGPGYRESTYEEALCVELALRGIPFVRQPVVTLHYKGHPVGEGRLDLLAGDVLIVELKAVDAISDIHVAQLISYLKATNHQLGLLLNFNVSSMADGVRRVVLSKPA